MKKLASYFEENGPFWAGVAGFFLVLDLLTAKTAVLSVQLFPSFDNVLGDFAKNYAIIGKSIVSSFKLLSTGVFFGILVGFVLGILVGFVRRVFYWMNPIIRVMGPIPATAWVPISLVMFPTTFQASAFIIALAVWFPVVVMTSNGIQNIPAVYFEVGKTLGAGNLFQVFRIGIPASLPSIFQGIFYGVCSAFIALMTAEMFGVDSGLGWYIVWQKGMFNYSGVYAGLIVIAVFCSIIILILGAVRGRLLAWQKGILK